MKKTFKCLHLPAAMIVFCIGFAQAQVELRADSNHVETGNPLGFHIRIPASKGRPDSLVRGAWEGMVPPENIIKESRWQSDGQYFSKNLDILFFDADTLQLPSLPVAFPNGDTAFSNPLTIIVTATPSPDDLNDMAPIKEIHREETRWTDYWPWILGAALLFGLVGLLYWLAYRKPKTKVVSRVFETPPHQLALKKLEALAHKQLISKGFVKEYYAELTFIVREYLEARFQAPVLESTTEETLALLKKSDFPPALHGEIKMLLEQADLAKFAKIVPPEAFHTLSFELSQKIIRETRPSPADSDNAR